MGEGEGTLAGNMRSMQGVKKKKRNKHVQESFQQKLHSDVSQLANFSR